MAMFFPSVFVPPFPLPLPAFDPFDPANALFAICRLRMMDGLEGESN
jgi:hypothetical protein